MDGLQLQLQLQLIVAASAAVFGLLIGSFLNVVALRLPGKQSIVFPPSHCVQCKHRLGVFDLVPLLSYIGLRGKCRYCGQRISPIYPLGELVTALSFAWAAWHIGPVPELAAALLLAAILIAAALSDLKYMIIPNRLVMFSVCAAVAVRLYTHPLPWWSYAAAALIGSGILYFVAWISKGGIGGGDIKLYIFIGLMLGIPLTLMSIFAACLLGTLYGVVLVVLGKYKRGTPMPFAPFIAGGVMLVYLYGDTWLSAYFDLIFHIKS